MGEQPRREPGSASKDPVKDQGILAALTRKERAAAKAWQGKWGFYGQLRQIQEEEAINIGMTLEEYRAALRSLSCQAEPRQYPVSVDPSPRPLPVTTNGVVGHRARITLERYGRVVRTARDYPTRPPLPPGQVYDPYKQTMLFLGAFDGGDPISHQLPPDDVDCMDDSLMLPRHLAAAPFDALLHFQ